LRLGLLFVRRYIANRTVFVVLITSDLLICHLLWPVHTPLRHWLRHSIVLLITSLHNYVTSLCNIWRHFIMYLMTSLLYDHDVFDYVTALRLWIRCAITTLNTLSVRHWLPHVIMTLITSCHYDIDYLTVIKDRFVDFYIY